MSFKVGLLGVGCIVGVYVIVIIINFGSILVVVLDKFIEVV